MSRHVAPSGSARVATLLMLLVMALGVTAIPALATEVPVDPGVEPAEEEHSPTINEIGTQSKTAKEYLPEAAEAPPFMRFLSVPLFIVGILVALALLAAYLTWQPRFAEERRSKRRR